MGLGSGAVLLLLLALAKRVALLPPRASWPGIIVGGLLAVAVFNLAVAWAQLSTSTARAAVLTITMPMMSAVLAWAVLGERPDRRRAVALALGALGVAILAMLAACDNSNGGLWLAYTGQYGDARDRGAYVASAVNDGPFFSLLFLGASGLADIPMIALVAALVPFLLGVVVGNLDPKWRDVLKPVPNIVIPFFAFALGTGINLGAVVSGGMSGLILGLIISPITGGLVYLGYRMILRRGGKSGLGFAAGTTAGNAIATPAVVAAADPNFQQYVATATAQVAACVLISSILAPILASYFLKRAGELKSEDADVTGGTPTLGEARGEAL
ncbi:hypothetical protein G6F22_012597 [Rhizopus arrhizus]|nr:hypothetical protein G6F22_012597 [Rhizopus arrhizus]